MKNNILNSGADWLAKLGILGVLGITPIFFNYFYPTSIDLTKIVIFKIFTLLLLFGIIWRFSKFKLELEKGAWRKLLPFFSLFIFLGISLFFSVDINTSWFGAYGRYEGLTSWLFYGLWAILLIFHLGDNQIESRDAKIRQLIVISSLSGFLVSLYAIFQLFGLDFITWAEPANITGRAVSSFGQPNYLACWLLIVLPFSAYLFYTAKNNLGRIIWTLIFITELGALFSTGSRAAFLVFLVISVLWFLWFLAQKKILSGRKIVFIISVALAVALFFIAFLAISNQSRFNELTNFKKGSAYVRLELWQTGLESYLKKPILGYGLDNQKEVYVKYYDPNLAIYSNPNVYSDRAHNLILDTLLTSGIIGLLFFIYFLRWVYLNLFNSYINNRKYELSAFLLWSLTAYLISLMFNFSVTVTNIYFWLIVALACVFANKPLLIIKTGEKNSELIRLVVVASAAVVLFYGINLEINRLKSDYYFNNALAVINKSEYFTALTLKVYVFDANLDIVTSSFYNQALSLRFIESLPKMTDKSSTYAASKDLMITDKMLPGSNFENNFVKAFINGMLSRRGLSDIMFQNLAISSPRLPKIYLAWGDVLFFNKDYAGAKVKFETALNLLPDSNSPYINNTQRNYLEIYKTQIKDRLTKVNLLLK